jgi:hypothetical protein
VSARGPLVPAGAFSSVAEAESSRTVAPTEGVFCWAWGERKRGAADRLS